MLKLLEYWFSIFTKITTGVVFVTAVFIQIFVEPKVDIGVEILWQDLIVSSVCAFCSLILYLNMDQKKEVKKYVMLARIIICYICENLVVLLLGSYFSWFSFKDWKQVVGMLVTIAFVFGFVMIVSYMSESRVAERMNRKLRERN